MQREIINQLAELHTYLCIIESAAIAGAKSTHEHLDSTAVIGKYDEKMKHANRTGSNGEAARTCRGGFVVMSGAVR